MEDEYEEKRSVASDNLLNAPVIPLAQLGHWGPRQHLTYHIDQDGWIDNWATNAETNYFNFSGLYIFWWIGDRTVLEESNRVHLIKGKKYKQEEDDARYDLLGLNVPGNAGGNNIYLEHEITYDFLWRQGVNCKEKCALYIGKSSGVYGRVDGHVKWQTSFGPLLLGNNQNPMLLPRHSGSQQFRVGFEYLFKHTPLDVRRDLMLNSVGLTVHPTRADDVSFRFYEEDYLIGSLRPAFNVDSER